LQTGHTRVRLLQHFVGRPRGFRWERFPLERKHLVVLLQVVEGVAAQLRAELGMEDRHGESENVALRETLDRIALGFGAGRINLEAQLEHVAPRLEHVAGVWRASAALDGRARARGKVRTRHV
jgi:hypothetical protein